MNAYCPDCETELDQYTGICPACRWDPTVAAREALETESDERELSITERYRGTEFDVSLQQAAFNDATRVSRSRAVVVVGLVAGVTAYGVVLSAFGIL